MARYGTPRDAPVAYEEALEKRFSATPDNVINLVALAGAEDAAANAADAPWTGEGASRGRWRASLLYSLH